MKKRKKQVLRILCGAAAFCVLLLTAGLLNLYRAYHVEPLAQSRLDALDLSAADKLMIVAHPDDEVIWGGAHLLEGGYLVVCITNGRNSTRKAEFEKAVTQSGNLPLILDYPDKVNFLRDDWESVKDGIMADLQTVIRQKDWSLIVTHNQAGEYGHQHHKMTHALTVDTCSGLHCTDVLYVFGTYYKAADLPDVRNSLTPVSDDVLRQKTALCDIYSSQDSVMEKLRHMFPYELWTKYET